jgi:hypothetical protein
MLILELPKVPEEDDGRPVWPWLKFMKSRSEAEMNALAEARPEVKMAAAEVKKLSWSERRRMRADARQIWRWDMASMIQGAREEGIKEEREKNEKRLEEERKKNEKQLKEEREKNEKRFEEEQEKNEKRLEETALKMKEWGDSLEKIHAITGLPSERIEKL